MDFDQKTPYLEVRVSKSSEDSRDELIHHFMAQGPYGQRKPWFTYVGKDETKDLDYWRLDWIENEPATDQTFSSITHVTTAGPGVGATNTVGQ